MKIDKALLTITYAVSYLLCKVCFFGAIIEDIIKFFFRYVI
jgi:hypothetical protein